MNLKDLILALENRTENTLRLTLPDGAPVPAEFHVTEVGHVTKRFVDCGGTVRTEESCVLQVWIDPNDADHRLASGKLARILKAAEAVLPGHGLPVEFEHELPAGLCRYRIGGYAVDGDALVFRLENKHADCLAKDICAKPAPVKIGAPVPPSSGGCCGPRGCC